MTEVVAVSFTNSEGVKWEDFTTFFTECGYALTDENEGIFEHESEDKFKGSVFEDAGYMLFEERDGLLPNEVFDYILSIEDENALVSLGVDTGWGVEVDSEMNLKEFRKHFLAAQTEEE